LKQVSKYPEALGANEVDLLLGAAMLQLIVDKTEIAIERRIGRCIGSGAE
jgi:hypothetical protein